MSQDILLFENGSGGEIAVLNNDISLVEALFQQAYLMLFGGNLKANTTGNEIPTQQREDWWANALFFSQKPDKQFNSNTERVLDNVTLNTAGRIDIVRAVKSDLNGLKDIADIVVEVIIQSESRLEIKINLNKPGVIEDKILQFIWDNASKEVIIDRII